MYFLLFCNLFPRTSGGLSIPSRGELTFFFLSILYSTYPLIFFFTNGYFLFIWNFLLFAFFAVASSVFYRNYHFLVYSFPFVFGLGIIFFLQIFTTHKQQSCAYLRTVLLCINFLCLSLVVFVLPHSFLLYSQFPGYLHRSLLALGCTVWSSRFFGMFCIFYIFPAVFILFNCA